LRPRAIGLIQGNETIKLQSLLPALITAAFLSTAYGGDTYWDSATYEHRTIPGGNNYFTTTHVPGDEAGKSARPPIRLGRRQLTFSGDDLRGICETLLRDTVQNACYKAGVYKMPIQGGVYHPDDLDDGIYSDHENGTGRQTIRRKHAASNDLCVHEWGGLGWDSSKGVAYIQATGGFCYYYNKVLPNIKSAGRGGQNLWRYDTKKCNGSDDHWGCKK
jgi:hypothetical protein